MLCYYGDYADFRSRIRWARRGPLNSCRYCRAQLKTTTHWKKSETTNADPWVGREQTGYCEQCGWFQYYWARRAFATGESKLAEAILRRFEIGDVRTPVQAVARHLRRHFDDRFLLHPRKFEELVADIFREHGYRIELTAFSKDGGVDIYLFENATSQPIAVQVKRYKRTRRIGISAIREFVGALVMGGLTRGVYVTTSNFTSASKKAFSDPRYARPINLELWGADRLFAALGLYLGNKSPPHEEFYKNGAQSLWRLSSSMNQGEVILCPPPGSAAEVLDVPLTLSEMLTHQIPNLWVKMDE